MPSFENQRRARAKNIGGIRFKNDLESKLFARPIRKKKLTFTYLKEIISNVGIIWI